MKNTFNRLSISTQLVFLLTGFAILLALVLASILDNLFTKRTQEGIGRHFSELAVQATDKLDRSLFERYREILLLANKTELGNLEIPIPEKRQMLEVMQKTYSFYAWLGITDNDGRVLVATNKLLEGVNVASRPWFKNALNAIHLTDVHDAVLLSKLLRPDSTEPMRFIDIAFPYRDQNGRTAGIFGAHLNLEWAQEIEKSMLRQLAKRSGVDTLIVSKDMVVILGPEALVGTTLSLPKIASATAASSGYSVEKFDDGRTYLLGYSKSEGYDMSPSLGWTVVVRQDIDTAYAPVVEFRRQVVLTGLAIASLFAMLGYFLARRVSQPLRLIATSAQHVEAGQSKSIADIHGGYREIGMLRASLQSLIGKLQENEASMRQADQRKDEFLATLAHELRNPLAPLSAAGDLLSLSKADEAQQQRLGEVISRQARHMTGLIDDLLDVSRVTRGLVTLEEQPVVMQEVVAEAVEQVRPMLEIHQHRFQSGLPQHPAFVMGDKKRLVQVVANLLNNAAKYTPDGGEVQLALLVHEGQVELSVRDNGIGMAPSLMEHAFELFIQATRKTDRSKGGLGVGLALSKRLVQLHGGVLSAHSAGQNQGSEFIMSLPALQQAVEPRQLATTQVHPIAAQAGLKVLIVDDNVDAAELLRLLLESTGHTVHVEYHPIRALEQARAFAPDVCLLDIGLPEISGNELARRLRQLPAMADAALIAITGYGQPQDRADALAAGFDYHLVKPVDRLQLLATLADIARTCVVN